ncbi:MAG TPA: hypothetical protein VGI10_07890 [Polyangiaceae bacterium]|jgi:hypothetical protein
MATSKGTDSERADDNDERESERPASNKPRRKRVDPELEPIPVISGRYMTAAVILGAATLIPSTNLGNLLEPPDPPGSDVANWVPGKTGTIRLTVVTADEASLTCASPQSFEGKHCAYKSESEPWPRDPNQPLDDNKVDIIQPYRTWLDNKLILVSDVWAQPELALRVHREPAAGMQADKLARFVTECKVKFVGRMDKPDLRWQPGQAWGVEQQTIVAAATECKIIDEPSGECPAGPICVLFR